jgi:beta-phosphoglucomutase
MLKAVLFDFNGVVIDDEWLHEKLLVELLLEENLVFTPEEMQQTAPGRTDRAVLIELCNLRGRVLTEANLDAMIHRKAIAYQREIGQMETLPIYDGVMDSIAELKAAGCQLAVVSGALRSEIQTVLDRTHLTDSFSFIVSAEDVPVSKPEPDGYLLGMKKMTEMFPELDLKLENFLAIEDSFPGIRAAKAAGISVVGVAHRYPFHMMQRTANWAVDSLADLELARLIPDWKPAGTEDDPILESLESDEDTPSSHSQSKDSDG